MRRVFFLTFFYMMVLPAAFSLSLSLDEAVKLGIDNNLDLKKSLIDLSMSEYSAGKVWSEVFPTITGTVGTSFSTSLVAGNTPGANANQPAISAGLGLNLTLNAGIPFTIKNIKLAYQTRLLSYEDARKQIELQITKSFYSLITDRDSLASLDYAVQLAQLQYERDQVAFNNGMVGELALMQSRLGLDNVRYNLSAARSDYANRMSEFLLLLDIERESDITLEGKVEITRVEADADQLIRDNLPRRPDIIGRRQEIERLENAEKQTTLSTKAPSLRLATEWNARSFTPFNDSLSASATLSIPIDPLIPGTTRNQSVMSAKNAVEKARLDLQSTENAAAAQIRALAASLHNSWDSIEIARLSVGVAERGYELTEMGFRNGTVDSLKLEDARNNLINARQRLLQSELSYFNMILDISAALNINWKDLMK